ncbi:GNAT family N-acetyltransferase [Streptomonospora sediminis]
MPSAQSGAEPARGLQERAARALPAEHTEDAGGWLLRYCPGGAWWVQTALPHGGAGPDEMLVNVAAAEAFYARHGASAGFQVTPGACSRGLDRMLARRGYRRRGALSLQSAPTSDVLRRAPADPLPVSVADRPTRVWFDTWRSVQGGDGGGSGGAEWELLRRVARPSAYACALLGGVPVAVGRAVADTGWAGVFGMAALPEARGRGAARSVLAALADWAGEYGLSGMYLQVEQCNAPARRLYARAGFSEVCGYHYRTAGGTG